MEEKNSLKIISLGGFGQVTNNMFVYETERNILLVDCGMGFPTEEMLGVDLTIPDTSYLDTRKEKIRGLILTHGHDDHIGALPYILPRLPKIPIFGSRWALALAKDKLRERGFGANFEEVNQKSKISLGEFKIEFVEMTHSIPETLHLVITTPFGIFYHAPDFKMDLTPVMGKPADQNLIADFGKRGVLCLLSDCLRAEKQGFTPSESKLEEMFEREIEDCKGRFFVTTMSSNISRFKQAIDVSLRNKRRIVLVGRSVDKNITLALKLRYLNYSSDVFVPLKDCNKFPPSGLTLLVAGSQGQPGSALERIVADEHEIKIKPEDKIVFSTDYIPGNELQVYSLIDDILRIGAQVAYADIASDVHVSGHGQSQDLKKLLELVKPKYVIPIGGNLRHMVAYRKMAGQVNYQEQNILVPKNGEVIEFANERASFKKKIPTRTIMIDALGVGDVGNVVLRDRQVLSSEGMVVIIVQLEQGTLKLVEEPDIISRGFVYARESESLIFEAKREIKRVVARQKVPEVRFLRRSLQEALERFFYNQTGRQPMVLTVAIEV
ncbi:MAG: ribonuclease J [bacterium]|nr:ribonuclease J [bacterium]